MRQIASSNKGGFTLVEVLIALVVLLLVFLAMMQTALVSIESNTKNLLRDGAVSVAEQRMNEARNLSWIGLVSDGADTTITRNIRNKSIDYVTRMTVTPIDSETRQITIVVTWQWKGENLTYRISSIRKQ